MITEEKEPRAQGFSLVEVMYSMTITGFLVLAVTSFTTFALNTQAVTTGKLLISRDVRYFTQEFSKEARGAGYWELYDNPTSQIQLTDDKTTGDFILFFFENYSSELGRFQIYKVTGFFREAEVWQEGPVVRFTERGSWESPNDYLLPEIVNGFVVPSNKDTDVEQSVVVELARGLADGHLFYNFAERNAIIIRGEIEEEEGRVGESTINTYNFTVYPRG